MSTFGDQLKRARTQKNLSQQELADLMDFSQATISQFERGDRLPTPSNIDTLAEHLGVSRKELAGDDQGNFEKTLLMRNIDHLSPENIRKINDIIESFKK